MTIKIIIIITIIKIIIMIIIITETMKRISILLMIIKGKQYK